MPIRLIQTTGGAIDSRLDPDNPSDTLQTLRRVVVGLSKKLRIEFLLR
jgi:hypothetical protein